MRRFLPCMLLSVALSLAPTLPAATHHFGITEGKFEMDGKPFQIISGEIHYPRIPRARWAHDLAMAKAMGLNTITVYTFWNEHEPEPGKYDFSGNNDVVAFLREAQKQGLYVILRPGPYVCAEWEFGGFPAWLEKDPTAQLRTNDPKYMNPVRTWLKRLGKELAPLQAANGGPIIAVQIENEYGSYGKDRDYIRTMRQAVIDAGFDKTFLYSTDGGIQIQNDALSDMFTAVNFGPGSTPPDSPDFTPRKEIAYAQKQQPTAPVLVGEYWAGWFSHWGNKWDRTKGQQEATELEWMLRQNYGVSIYMFSGGTSFGFMNGANSSKPGDYEPDVTSYDYDSALQEDGEPSYKFALFRDAIQRATGKQPPAIPASAKPVAMPEFSLNQSASLWKTLPAPHVSEHPLSMEDLDQAYGYILYRTTLQAPTQGKLTFDTLHGYADIYVDGKLVGTLNRNLHQDSLDLNITSSHAQLDILIENTSRINYGPRLQGERIGILGDAHIAGKTLTNWQIYPLPMLHPDKMTYTDAACTGACFYRGKLHVDKPADTYLDTRSLKKGVVWVNGKPLGRFWNIGPQGSLYLPASWLHTGDNEVDVFDLYAAPGAKMSGIPQLVTDLGHEEAKK